MSIILLGMNHRTAPVEMRERLAFDSDSVSDALEHLVDHDIVEEGLIISTCNRVEMVASAPAGLERGLDRLTNFLCGARNIPSSSIDAHLYRRSGPEAVAHVFRVASSLDSMVVGEPQILGQVKDAYQHAVSAGTIGRVLSQLMDRAISVARRVRNETAISQNPVSVSSVAVELASKIFGDLADKTVLLVGAGEMAELAAQSLMAAGSSRLIVTNRTAERAEGLAQKFGGGVVSFEAFYDVFPLADIVICSTGAADYVVRHDDVKAAMRSRKKRPLLCIDISVPRNIDPAISSLDNTFLFDVDDLESVIEANKREREKEAKAAEAIIEMEVQHFILHLRTLDIGPSVVEVKQLLSEMALAELKRNRKRLGVLNDEQEAAIRDVLIPALVAKLSHPMILHMRTSARNGERSGILDELRKMMKLD